MREYFTVINWTFPTEGPVYVTNCPHDGMTGHYDDTNGNYLDRIISVSPIHKRGNMENYYVSNIVINLRDDDKFFKTIMQTEANRDIKNISITVRLMRMGSGDTVTTWTSIIRNSYFKNDIFTIECVNEPENLYTFYPTSSQRRFNYTDWPNMSNEALGKICPYAWGMAHSWDDEDAGAAVFWRIDVGKYFVSEGEVEAVEAAWDGGVGIAVHNYVYDAGGDYSYLEYTAPGDEPDFITGAFHGRKVSGTWVYNPIVALKDFIDTLTSITYDAASFATVQARLENGGTDRFDVNFYLDQPFEFYEVMKEFAKNFFFRWHIGTDGKIYLTEIPAVGASRDRWFRESEIIYAKESNQVKPVGNRITSESHYAYGSNVWIDEAEVSDATSIGLYGEFLKHMKWYLLIGEDGDKYILRVAEMMNKYLTYWKYPARTANIIVNLHAWENFTDFRIGKVVTATHKNIADNTLTWEITGEKIDMESETAELELRSLSW